jgi:hypothetical protein
MARCQQNMNMICHEYVCVDIALMFTAGNTKQCQVQFIVGSAFETCLTIVSPLDNVLRNPSDIQARRSGHV